MVSCHWWFKKKTQFLRRPLCFRDVRAKKEDLEEIFHFLILRSYSILTFSLIPRSNLPITCARGNKTKSLLEAINSNLLKSARCLSQPFVFNVCKMSIQCLFNVYSMSIQCLLSTHCTFNVYLIYSVPIVRLMILLPYSHSPKFRDAIACKKKGQSHSVKRNFYFM